MTSAPKALLFDLDGVLVDSEPLHRKTWREAFTETGIPFREEYDPMLQGRTGGQIIEWLSTLDELRELKFDPEIFIGHKRRLYSEQMAEGLRPIPGVDGFLRAKKGTIPLGLVTSAKLKTVGLTLQLFQWRNIFEALVGADHVTRHKPAPDAYEHAAARLKLRPSECLVFEDSEVGIQSARAAGARICALSTTLPEDQLRDLGATWVIPDFNDSPQLAAALEGYKPGRIFAWLTRKR